MKACANSMGSLQVQSAAPCCSVSQLKPGRVRTLRERRAGVSEPSIVSLRCTCQSNFTSGKANLVKTFSFIKSDTPARSQDSPSSKQSALSGGLNDKSNVGPKGKPVLEAQGRPQDSLETADKGDDGGRRSRTSKQPAGERRRRVQVVGDYGMVDLETQLGLVSDQGSVGREDNEVADGGEGNCSESSRSGDGPNEIGRGQSSNAEIRPESDVSTEAGSSLIPGGTDSYMERRPLMASRNVFDVELADQMPRVSFATESSDQDGWVQSSSQGPRSLAELPGGRRVVELVAAWDGLAGRLRPELVKSSDSALLLRALKLSVMALQNASAPASEDGRSPLCRALAVAHSLADLGMDAEVISTGLLRDVVDAGLVSYAVIEKTLGGSIPRLLHDCSRVRHIPSRVDTLDDDNSKALRQFCLAFHDIRAVIVELASRLDTMRHINSFPRYRQQILALETMQIYAPLAHAIGTGAMSLELEDLGFRVLFPDSYSYVENWLKSHWVDGSGIVEECREMLSAALEQDTGLQELVEKITVTGRYKSRFSTMRKLLKDGRKPEEVFDVLGLRVILEPKAGDNGVEGRELGVRSCYRAMEIATRVWKEVPGRLKDYIGKPKQNGYQSLHLAVHLCGQNEWRPPMEIQIRTVEMDANAEAGQASHSLYKGGLTDPEQVKNLKLIMVAATNVAATRFGEIARNAASLEGVDPVLEENDQIFRMFDRNQDGVISVDEFREVIHELGADTEDALELMRIVDLNTDGSVSAEEFGKFRHQIQISLNLAGRDREFSSQLGTKLPQMPGAATQQLCLGSGAEDELCVPDDSVDRLSQDYTEASELASSSGGGSTHMVVKREPHPLISGKGLEVSTAALSNAISSPPKIEQYESTERTPSSINENDLTSKSVPARPAKQVLSLVKPVRLLLEKPTTPMVKNEPVHSPEIAQSSNAIANAVLEEVEVPIELDLSSQRMIEEELSTFRQFLGAGEKTSARRLIMMLSKKFPAHIPITLHRASLERKCGDMVAAGGLYSQAIRAFKLKGDLGIEYVRALQAWGSLEAQIQNPRRARSLFIESLNASQKGEVESGLRAAGVYGLHGWATLEEKIGNWSKARSLLQRAAELEPGNAVVHQSRARLEARAHNYVAARSHFKLAVEAAPEDTKCWHAWAMFEASQRKWGKMRELFARALEADPENTHSLQAWAHQEGRIGTVDSRLRARNLFQECADINPKNVHCWQAWAVLEQESGNFSGARVLFERGLDANPQSVPCLQAYAHMERKCGDLEIAQKLLLVALAVEPQNAACLMELAVVEDTFGNFEVAQELYRQAAIVDKRKSRVKRLTFESRKMEFQAEKAARRNELQKRSSVSPDRAWKRSPASYDKVDDETASANVGSEYVESDSSSLRIPIVAVSSQSER